MGSFARSGPVDTLMQLLIKLELLAFSLSQAHHIIFALCTCLSPIKSQHLITIMKINLLLAFYSWKERNLSEKKGMINIENSFLKPDHLKDTALHRDTSFWRFNDENLIPLSLQYLKSCLYYLVSQKLNFL